VLQFFQDFPVSTYSTLRGEAIPEQLSTLPTIELQQTHSAGFTEILAPDSQFVPDIDAAFTRLPGVHLKVKHADCLPVVFYHPLPLVGIIHAGRKGTEAGITGRVLAHLRTSLGITSGLEVWLGPAICAACYQIDRERDLRYDLIKENVQQVRSVFSESDCRIMQASRCTAHEPDSFFSYRREGEGVPMNWSGISLAAG
jgi:copper oxidase (laccase) domain-containing protein